MLTCAVTALVSKSEKARSTPKPARTETRNFAPRQGAWGAGRLRPPERAPDKLGESPLFLRWTALDSKSEKYTFKSSQVRTPQLCKEQGARIKKGGGMPRMILRSHPVPSDVAPVGQCAGSSRLYSARSKAWSCACVLREKAHSSA
jgi:hypothetical protein